MKTIFTLWAVAFCLALNVSNNFTFAFALLTWAIAIFPTWAHYALWQRRRRVAYARALGVRVVQMELDL